jgi:hypothetical protein
MRCYVVLLPSRGLIVHFWTPRRRRAGGPGGGLWLTRDRQPLPATTNNRPINSPDGARRS